MKMFKSRWEEITEVEVERVNDSSVWINGRRKDRFGSYECYHETWEAAHAQMMNLACSELKSAQRQLAYAQEKLNKLTEMKQ